jgi:hypothetical protein
MRHAAGGSRNPPELDQGDGMHHQHGEQRRQDVKSHETRIYAGYANHPEHDLRAAAGAIMATTRIQDPTVTASTRATP